MSDAWRVIAGGLCCAAVLTTPIAWLATRSRRSRPDQLLAWTEANGWTVTHDPDVDWYRRLPGRNPEGVTVAVSRIIDGHLVSVGRYSVTDVQTTTVSDPTGGTSTTTTPSTHHYVVTVVRLHRPLPATVVEPRGALSRLTRRVIGPGETATGHRTFDRAYRIDTTDPTMIRQWCTPDLIAWHLAHRPPAWSVHRDELLCLAPGQLRPADIPRQVAPVLRLATLLS